MEGPRDTKNGAAPGENHQAAVTESTDNERDKNGENSEEEVQAGMDDEKPDSISTFLADYCKRGTTKCKKCKTRIANGELRIGKSVLFKTKYIYQYYHVPCAFASFVNAKTTTSIITCMEEIGGLQDIKANDRAKIHQLVEETNKKREQTMQKQVNRPAKKTIPLHETPKARISRLKASNLPTISILYTNADQLTPSKMTELRILVERKKPLIVAVCEIKPKNGSERSLKDYEIPNYSTHPVNLDSSNGRGIAVYTHKSLENSTIQITPSQSADEACLLEICLCGGDTLLFGCLYRSPTMTDTSSKNNDSINRLLQCISLKKYSHTCIVGDFNYKAINWATGTTTHGDDSPESHFIETIRDCFLLQHVSKPTRRRGNDDPSVLDLVLSNEEMPVGEITHNPPLGKSDHDVLTFEFQCYIDYSKPKDRYVFEKGNYADMRDSARISKWREEYVNLSMKNGVTTEELWTSLKSVLTELKEAFVPVQKASNKPAWKDKGSIPIDANTRKAIQEKEKSHRLWMSPVRIAQGNIAKSQYTRARNKVKSLLRKAKRRFERGIAMEAKTNPKKFFAHTRRNLKTKSGVAPLLSDPKDKDSMKFNEEEKATILLKQFSSVFTREQDGEIPRITSRTQKKIADLVITEEMVLAALKSLNVNKSCGPDNLHPRLLLELAETIALPVSILFNATLKDGILPEDWKLAFITAIYKKGSRHLLENYRPISLTAILCKVMEKFVRDNVVLHLLQENLLSNKQYGFITGRSTSTQLLYYLDECLKKIANGGVIDAIYLDFSKAFDTVPHRRLLRKLEAYGITGGILRWIKGFLQGRTQQVIVNGSMSATAPVLSGIPQGTVLGPVLFVIYINDLLDNITSDGLMFADDTKLFRLISSREDALALQSDLQKLEQWSRRMGLKVQCR